MYIFDDHIHYHKLNQQFLRFLGLWPYKKTKFDCFRAMCFNMLLISYMIVQLAQLVIADLNINVVIKILSDIFLAFLYVLKFNMFFFDTKGLKQMLEEIINSRRMLTDAQEIKITEHYAQQGKYVTTIIMLLLIFTTLTKLIVHLLPDILDFFRPLNESRVHYLITLNEYNLDQGIQFYSLVLYIITSFSIGTFTILAISSMFLLIALHCCAIFKICSKKMNNRAADTAKRKFNVISYRIKQSVEKKIIACSNKRNVIVERIIKTVELHQNAQKLFQLLTSSFRISFLIVLTAGTCSLITSLYRVLHAITCMDNIIELLEAIYLLIGHEIYLFGGSIMGQQIVDHANELFNAIYMSLWYKAPLTVQKSLLFIMQISSKGVVPTLGCIYVLVLENFTSLMNMSISFMMVIYSVSM